MMNTDKAENVFFFLPWWDKKKPTREDQTGFMLCEMTEEDECMALGGKVYTSHDYHNSEPKKVIEEAIRKERPQWAVGVGNAATILLGFKRQKKILINPTVTLNDLNWVTPETIRDTWAFFSADHEKDYETYSRVYRNVAYFGGQQTLYISDVSGSIKTIISE